MQKETGQSRHGAGPLLAAVRTELRRGIVGQEAFVEGLLVGLLAGGHVLIEGVPGLGKTRAVNLLARICRGTCSPRSSTS